MKVRIFGEQRAFDKTVQTHIFLSTEHAYPEDKIRLSEKFIGMYGLDNNGSGDLEFYERDMLEENAYWTGRTWDFNELHSLVNDSPNGSYTVRINNNEDGRFIIAILFYNQLIDLFSTS